MCLQATGEERSVRRPESQSRRDDVVRNAISVEKRKFRCAATAIITAESEYLDSLTIGAGVAMNSVFDGRRGNSIHERSSPTVQQNCC